MYITYVVKVSEDKHAFGGGVAEADVVIEIPEEFIENIDTGNILSGLTKVAVEKFNALVPEDVD